MSLMSGTSNRYFVINRDSMPQERSPIPDGRIDAIEAGMTESEWTSSVLGYRVIKAFNNIMTYSLVHGGLPKGSKNRITLSLAGDDIKAKQLVIALLDNMGFDGLDVGRLPSPGASSLGCRRIAWISHSNRWHYCSSGPTA